MRTRFSLTPLHHVYIYTPASHFLLTLYIIKASRPIFLSYSTSFVYYCFICTVPKQRINKRKTRKKKEKRRRLTYPLSACGVSLWPPVDDVMDRSFSGHEVEVDQRCI